MEDSSILKKTRTYTVLRYWKARLKQVLSNSNRSILIQYREQYLDQVELDLNINQIRERLEVAKQDWNKVIQNGKEIREKEILDFHHSKIGNETEPEKKKRKEVIQQIIKAKKRNHQFQYMIKYLGKGVKGVLRKLYVRNEQ